MVENNAGYRENSSHKKAEVVHDTKISVVSSETMNKMPTTSETFIQRDPVKILKNATKEALGIH
ncbi:hypothetical protein ACFL1Q_02315 [Patescibacteria group bacterium]